MGFGHQRLLYCFFNFVRAQAFCAYKDLLDPFTDPGPHALQVYFEPSPGNIMGMADVRTGLSTAPAYRTFPCHIDDSFQDHYIERTMNVNQQNSTR